MRTNETDIDNPEVILNCSDNTVFISFDVEYNPIAGQEARVAVNILDVRGTSPS